MNAEPRQWVAVRGVRFFRWCGSVYYPDGPRMVRVAEACRYTSLMPLTPALSYDGTTWEKTEAPCPAR